MDLDSTNSDTAVLDELGRRLVQRRLAWRLSQAELARQAGVGKRTVERIEAGESAQLRSWIRLLRALDLLPALGALIPAETIRPMNLLKQGGSLPRRVRAKGTESETSQAAADWTWGDDS